MKRREQIEYLEIALDVLDRAEGTIFYNETKKLSGWSDKDYLKTLDMLTVMLAKIKKIDREGDSQW
jgi:hypothetical protein